MSTSPGRPSPPRGGRHGWTSLLRRNKNRRLRSARVSPPPPLPRSEPAAAAPAGPRAAVGRRAPASTAAPGERRRRLSAVVLPVLAMLLGGGVMAGGALALHRFVTRSPHFALRTIVTTGLSHLRREEIIERGGLALGDNLFSFSLEGTSRRLQRDAVVGPWIASIRLHRELPGTLAVEIVERVPAAVLELGSLYLSDARGEAFKRATLDEAAAFPVITGLARDAYIHDRAGAQELVREGLSAHAAWQTGPGERPPIGEIHVDAAAGTTLYLRQGGTAVRLGRGDEATLAARLLRVDAVRAELARTGERPRVIYADAPQHPDRISVKLASIGPAATASTPRSPQQ